MLISSSESIISSIGFWFQSTKWHKNQTKKKQTFCLHLLPLSTTNSRLWKPKQGCTKPNHRSPMPKMEKLNRREPKPKPHKRWRSSIGVRESQSTTGPKAEHRWRWRSWMMRANGEAKLEMGKLNRWEPKTRSRTSTDLNGVRIPKTALGGINRVAYLIFLFFLLWFKPTYLNYENWPP